MHRSLIPLLATAALMALGPASARAQRPGLPAEGPSGWPPVAIGAKLGFDSGGFNDAFLLGAQLRVPVLPSGHVEIVPNADVTFLSGLKEYQFSPDAVLVTGGRRGGLYLGGGPVWLSSVYDGPDRETRTGWSFVVGIRSGQVFGAPFGTQFQLRETHVDGLRRRRVLSLGVNFPLWGPRGAPGNR